MHTYQIGTVYVALAASAPLCPRVAAGAVSAPGPRSGDAGPPQLRHDFRRAEPARGEGAQGVNSAVPLGGNIVLVFVW